jgi:hypothetical protein
MRTAIGDQRGRDASLRVACVCVCCCEAVWGCVVCVNAHLLPFFKKGEHWVTRTLMAHTHRINTTQHTHARGKRLLLPRCGAHHSVDAASVCVTLHTPKAKERVCCVFEDWSVKQKHHHAAATPFIRVRGSGLCVWFFVKNRERREI